MYSHVNISHGFFFSTQRSHGTAPFNPLIQQGVWGVFSILRSAAIRWQVPNCRDQIFAFKITQLKPIKSSLKYWLTPISQKTSEDGVNR